MKDIFVLPLPSMLSAAGVLLLFIALGVRPRKWFERAKSARPLFTFVVGLFLLALGIALQVSTPFLLRVVRPSNMQEMVFGRNYDDPRLDQQPLGSPFECERQCAVSEECGAWTFRLPNFNEATMCTLYPNDARQSPTANNSIVSGKKR
jgi:hypothetical protein